MTVNHDYNTPEEGKTNWDVPLNENFKRLDGDIEIRDESSNLPTYDPVEGSKFLATDTGEVYVGDGSQWEQIGEIPPAGGGGGAGVMVAQPGDVQATLDQAGSPRDYADQNYTVVKLRSGETYTPNSPYRVGANTVFDGNGAVIDPQHSSGDVVQAGQLAVLRNIYVDARKTSWSSGAMIHLDTAWGGQVTGPQMSRIENCRLVSSGGEGEGIRLQDSAAEGMGGFPVSGMVHGHDIGINLVADGGSSAFVNGVKYHGRISAFRVGITHNASTGAATNANRFFIGTQAHPDYSEWLWEIKDEGSRNLVAGNMWDTRFYPDETVAIARPSASYNNTILDWMHVLADWQFVNDSDYGSNAIGRINDAAWQRQE